MHALHDSFSLPSLINSTSPILLCQEVQRLEVLKKVAMYTRMLALAMTIFVLLRKASCMTISMKGFISKAFKASTRVKVTLIPKAIVSLLSLPSLLPSYSNPDFFCDDGPTDWVKECYNRQLEYQESLASYSKMRRKKYHYEYSANMV